MISAIPIGYRSQSEVLREYMSLLGRRFHKRVVVSSAETRLWTIPSDYIGHETCLSGWYEEWCLWAAEYLIRNGFASSDELVLVDVGAKIGVYTVRLAKLFNRVIAFEPSPLISQALQLNIDYNGLSNVTICRIGLSDVERSMGYRHVHGNLGSSHLTSRETVPGDDITVQVVRGDDAVELMAANVGYLKIDVEGHELQVLKGLVGTIRRCRPVIQFELFNSTEKAIHEVEDLLKDYTFMVITTKFDGAPRFIRVAIQLALGKEFWLSPIANIPRAFSEAIFAVPKERMTRIQ
jgi:FkbM family methyltransferase